MALDTGRVVDVVKQTDEAPHGGEGWVARETTMSQELGTLWAECGVTAEPVLREGSAKQELKKLIDEDLSLKLVVLAAAHSGANPGPLVQSLAKPQGLSARHIPVMVIPGALSREEIRALAIPMPVAPPEPGPEPPPAAPNA